MTILGQGRSATDLKSETKGSIFNTAIAANTDFFTDDLVPTETPTTFKIYITMDTAGILNVMRTVGGVTITEHLNLNVNLVANSIYNFEIKVVSGDSINLQYSVIAQILVCIVIELPE